MTAMERTPSAKMALPKSARARQVTSPTVNTVVRLFFKCFICLSDFIFVTDGEDSVTKSGDA